MARAAENADNGKRLSGHARREQLLEVAAELVLRQGLSACTLEEVAVQAGISKALVYKHFANRDELLRNLLQQEFDEIRGRGLRLAPPGTTIEKVHRTYIRRHLQYLKERGGLLKALTSDRGVIKLLGEPNKRERDSILRYFTRETIKGYRLPPDLAKLGMTMTMSGLDGAEPTLRRDEVAVDRAYEFWITFVLAGWAATSARFGDEDNAAAESTP